MTRTLLVRAALAVLTLTAVLTGCGTTNSGQAMTASSAPAGQRTDHNQADVTFAQAMIPHHQQAVDMAKFAPTRSSDPKLLSLASRIEQAQGPEIQQMTGWLTAWGAPLTSTGMNMPGTTTGNSMRGMSNSTPMPGMMSDTDMATLQVDKGTEFDRMWLRMMIQHHQGAIDMAKTELAQGSNSDAKALAQKIISAQQAEINEMNGLLSQS